MSEIPEDVIKQATEFQDMVDRDPAAYEAFDVAVLAILAERQRNQWQDMPSAPKDKPILGYWQYLYPGDKAVTEGVNIIEWLDDGKRQGWYDHDGVAADGVYLSWQPLPSPPKP